MKFIQYIIGVSCLVSLAACQNAQTEEKEAHDEHAHEEEGAEQETVELSEEQLKAVSIRLGSVENRNLNSVLRVNGALKVAPQDMADIAPLAGGVIRKILVTEGQYVKKGQPVAYIENTDIVELQRNYLVAVKEMQVAKENYLRQRSLSAAGAGVKKNLQQALGAYEVAKVQVGGLAGRLRQLSVSPSRSSRGRISTRIPVYSPISGYVTSISATTGGYADVQQSLMSVMNDRAVYAELKVFEKDIYSVKPGQKVSLRLTNHPQTALTGRVEKIIRTMDMKNRSIAVKVAVDNGQNTLLIPGMALSALVSTGNTDTPALPEDAVATIGDASYIFLLEKTAKEDGKLMYHFRRVQVTTGVTEMGYTQIIPSESIPANAKVVTSNAFYLSSMLSEHGEHAH